MLQPTHNQPRPAQLQSLSTVQVVDRAFQIYRANLRTFAQIVLVVGGIIALYHMVGATNSGDGIPWATISPLRAGMVVSALSLLGMGASDIAGMFLGTVGQYLIAVGYMTSYLVYTTARVYLGDLADVAFARHRGGRRVFAAALPGLLVLPATMLSAQLAEALPSLLWLFSPPVTDLDHPDMPILSILSALLRTWAPSLVYLIIGLALSARLLLAAPAVELEGVGPLAALRRSWVLSRGAFWRIFLALLVCAVIAGVLIALPRIVADAVLLGSASVDSFQPGTTLGEVGAELMEALAFPLFVAVPTLLYYGQRIRHEGYDIELQLSASREAEIKRLIMIAEGDARPEAVEMLARIDVALQLAPDHIQANYLRAMVRHKNGDPHGALADIERVARQLPKDPATLSLRGAIRLSLGDNAGAASDFALTQMVRPGFVDELHQIGARYYAEGKLEWALSVLDRLLLIQPEDAHGHYNRACILACQGEQVAALDSLAQAIRLDPRWRTQAPEDPDLTVLHAQPRFHELIAEPAGVRAG
jgi:hypothetical protein